jgi:thiamine kinase-like enzyme
VQLRKSKPVDAEKAKEVADELYMTKLLSRMDDLKKLPEYAQFDSLIAMGTAYESIDAIVARYKELYEKVTKAFPEKDKKLVVGHGDLCFSNILYSREANLLKLIDPKGALTEDDLYTDPYYDLAKLSHSICGCYDFFNSGLYQITMDRDMKIKLTIDTDLQPYVDIFKKYLEEKGYSYTKVRLYEASLFLSMLPYHMDQPGKVFGFLLNAIRILEEVETCTKN